MKNIKLFLIYLFVFSFSPSSNHLVQKLHFFQLFWLGKVLWFFLSWYFILILYIHSSNEQYALVNFLYFLFSFREGYDWVFKFHFCLFKKYFVLGFLFICLYFPHHDFERCNCSRSSFIISVVSKCLSVILLKKKFLSNLLEILHDNRSEFVEFGSFYLCCNL